MNCFQIFIFVLWTLHFSLEKAAYWKAMNSFLKIEVWCNGSTRDFGSLSSGSSPDISTNNVGFAERLGPGLQNQLEWFDSTTRLQMPLWCNGQHIRLRICWWGFEFFRGYKIINIIDGLWRKNRIAVELCPHWQNRKSGVFYKPVIVEFCGIRIVVIIPACHAGDGSPILPCRSKYGSDGREV